MSAENLGNYVHIQRPIQLQTKMHFKTLQFLVVTFEMECLRHAMTSRQELPSRGKFNTIVYKNTCKILIY